jgi:hypothetical protein
LLKFFCSSLCKSSFYSFCTSSSSFSKYEEAEKQWKEIEVYRDENSGSWFAYRFVDKKLKKVSKKKVWFFNKNIYN